jgi:DNA mismatch endonuclease (patch repair protein)
VILLKPKVAIFIHGCFWHRHGKRCHLTRLPKSRLGYWKPKLERNRSRDIQNQRKLRKQGWRVFVAWECQLGDRDSLQRRLLAFLQPQIWAGLANCIIAKV